MLASKFKSMLQRRKHRDLYDMDYNLEHLQIDIDSFISCFKELSKKIKRTNWETHLDFQS